MKARRRVLLAMSGGVDSSVAAVLLMEQAFEVIGVTMIMSSNNISKDNQTDYGIAARKVAEKLKIKHYIIDLKKVFKEKIIDKFVQEYISGRTPNPCVFCNKIIRWPELIKLATKLDCDYVATGHYARIEFQNNRYCLLKARDNSKDQSYFLWKLSQDELKRTIFPLGNYYKKDIRQIAKQNNLYELILRKESMDLCFIQQDSYRDFFDKHLIRGRANIKSGYFISTTGEILGRHKGLAYYTIGQRKGLRLSLGYPVYVVDIQPEKNRIILGKENDLYKSKMLVGDINLIKYTDLAPNFEVFARIRYKDKGTLSRINYINNYIEVNFFTSVKAIAPGQSAVFYKDNFVVAGGIILNAK